MLTRRQKLSAQDNELDRLRAFDEKLVMDIIAIQADQEYGKATTEDIDRLIHKCEQHSDCLKAIGALSLQSGQAK